MSKVAAGWGNRVAKALKTTVSSPTPPSISPCPPAYNTVNTCLLEKREVTTQAIDAMHSRWTVLPTIVTFNVSAWAVKLGTPCRCVAIFLWCTQLQSHTNIWIQKLEWAGRGGTSLYIQTHSTKQTGREDITTQLLRSRVGTWKEGWAIVCKITLSAYCSCMSLRVQQGVHVPQ